MEIRIRGETLPKDLLDLLAAITDKARLQPAGVLYDRAQKTVRLPITRRPLIKKRGMLPHVHDRNLSVPAEIVIRYVESVDIHDRALPNGMEEVQLLFGLQVGQTGIYLCSVEERRGKPCYSLNLRFSEMDLELKDRSSGQSESQAIGSL